VERIIHIIQIRFSKQVFLRFPKKEFLRFPQKTFVSLPAAPSKRLEKRRKKKFF
jgi:hypothetical protein